MQTKEQWNDGAAYLIFVRNILGFVGHILVFRKCWIVCVVQLFGLFLVNTFKVTNVE